MTLLILILSLLAIWSLLCWGVGVVAKTRGQSALGFFLLSFFISPLLGLIVVLIMKNEAAKDEARRREAERREERREEDRKREHEKQLETLRALTAAQQQAIPQLGDTPATPRLVADELAKLAELRDKGVLTSDEFEAQKRQILGRA